MVGTRPHVGDRPERSGLELPILQDRTVEATHHEPCEEHADALGHGGGIDGIGQVPGLLPLHHVDVGCWVEVAAVGAVFPLGLAAAGAPEICMADVVVVGDRDGGPVADHVAKLQAELDPADRVLRVAVGLVAGEEEQVGIGLAQALHQFGPRPRRARRVARHHGDRDPGLVGRIAADESLEHRLRAVPHAVGMVAGRIPTLDAEVGVPAGIEHGGAGDLDPVVAPLDLEPGLTRLFRRERKKLRGEFERAAGFGPHGDGVEGEGDHVAALPSCLGPDHTWAPTIWSPVDRLEGYATGTRTSRTTSATGRSCRSGSNARTCSCRSACRRATSPTARPARAPPCRTSITHRSWACSTRRARCLR